MVEKRVYNKGFYVHKKSALIQPKNQLKETTFIHEINEQIEDDTTKNNAFEKNSDTNGSIACDTLIFVNGDTLYGNVIILNDRWVAIDDCDSVKVKKPDFALSKIYEIHYSSGEIERITDRIKQQKDVVNDQENLEQKDNYDEDPHPSFIISIVFLLLTIVFLLIALSSKTVALLYAGALMLCIGAIIFSVISLIYHLARHNRKIAFFASILEVIVIGVSILALYLARINTELF